MENTTCVFCKIVQREAPASIVWEDDKVLVFLDIRPLNEGHTLVSPKEHYENIYETPDDIIAYIYQIVKQTAIIVKDATKADGITIIQQNGHAAGQEIFHLHVHVVPRYEGQKLPRFTDIPSAPREKLDTMAKRLQDKFPS